MIREEGRHLVSAAQKVRVARHPQSVLLGPDVARLNAQQDIVGRRVLLPDIVHVVGGNQADLVSLAHLHQLPIDLVQFGQVVILKLEEEPIAPEYIQVPFGRPPCTTLVAILEETRNLACQAT